MANDLQFEMAYIVLTDSSARESLVREHLS